MGREADPDELLRGPAPAGADRRRGDDQPDPGPPRPGRGRRGSGNGRSYRRWERPGPMQLWQLDIVGGAGWSTRSPGSCGRRKVVTGVDDHSRFCVIGAVVERATGRAVCLAFAAALAAVRGAGGGASPTTASSSPTGSAGRGGVVRQDLPPQRHHPPADPAGVADHDREGRAVPRHPAPRAARRRATRSARWRRRRRRSTPGSREYNADRPHQALDAERPVTPADRFTPGPEPSSASCCRSGCRRPWLPPPPTDRPTDRPTRRRRRRRRGGRPAAVGGWAGRVRPGRAAVGEHVAGRATVLARPGPGRADRPVLGRRRPDPPVHRRHPGQEPSAPT